MYISRVTLENVRAFSGPRNVDLTLTRPDGSHAGWTVLAGRNGSGKTSLVRAMALAASAPFVAVSLVTDFRLWITIGRSDAKAEVQVVPDYRADSSSVPDSERLDRLTTALRWSIDGVRGRTRPGGEVWPVGLTDHSSANGPWQQNSTGWFCAGYGPFRRLVGGAGHLSSAGFVGRLASLFHEDASLTEGVQWLVEQHLRALEGQPGAQELKQAALSVLGDGLLPDKYQVSDVNSEGLWVVSDGHRFPLREMSDGYRTVAALVVDLLKQLDEAFPGGLALQSIDGVPAVLAPGVVIIDEIDAHLHVSWQKRIGGWLKAHFPNIQFIVTTHSPYICQAADPGGLIRLPGPSEDQPPCVVDQDLYDRVVYGSGDDAVLSELFGLDSPYSEQAEELRDRLVALEVRVMRDQASEAEIAEYRALRRRLASSPATRAEEVAARLRADSEPDA